MRTAGVDGGGTGPRVWSVSELSRELERRLKALGRVAVEGEISQIKRAGSGHLYFGLKDLDALVSCAIWKSRLPSAVRFELEEGMRVVCHGELDVYKPRGTYSLIVDRVERKGLGELLLRFEALKKELAAKGWFERKRALPAYPRCIGLVTSRDGAALRDFLRTRSLRWPLYPVRLAHSAVQGAGAASEIAAAIRRLERSGVDLIVLTRGGGSIEDLWCFNELAVAEAIHDCTVPVVSAVGHETDFTLADFVADQRAHTPTDAAQRVIPDRVALLAELERQGAYLAAALDAGLERRERRLAELARTRSLRAPDWIFGDRVAALASLRERLRLLSEGALARRALALESLATRVQRSSPRNAFAERVRRSELAALGLARAVERRLDAAGAALGLAAARLEATSPMAVLGRGYSLTRRLRDGALVRDAAALELGEEVQTVLERGQLRARVVGLEPATGEGGGAAE